MMNDELFNRLVEHAQRPVPARPAHLRPNADQLRAKLEAKTPDELRQLAEAAEAAHHARVLATWADEHHQLENRCQPDTGIDVAALADIAYADKQADGTPSPPTNAHSTTDAPSPGDNAPAAENTAHDDRDAERQDEVGNTADVTANRGDRPRSQLVMLRGSTSQPPPGGGQVFLSYRTDDEPFGVAMLDRELSRRFGSNAVFLGSKSIPLGSDWEQQMFDAVAKSTALLVVIGRHWRNANNRRRLDDPADHVRREILHALDLDKQIIPVRLDVPPLSTHDLPDALSKLAGKHDIYLRFRSAKIDLDRLTVKLSKLVPALCETSTTQPTPTAWNVVERSRVNTLVQGETITISGGFHADPTLRGPEEQET